ncbi:MAG: hypothetical protein QXP27_08035, partial [Candidatus Methanomethyliaceae archaeon]
EPGIAGTFVGPITSEDYSGRIGEITYEGQPNPQDAPSTVQYSIPWVAMYVKSFFAGPLTSFLTGGPIEVNVINKSGAQETGPGRDSGFIQFPVMIRQMGAAVTINK